MENGKKRAPLAPIAYRRVVPPGYHQVDLALYGNSALLMNSGEADRDSETYRAYFNLGKVRNKTLEQEAQLRKLEWTLALYLDADLGPYIPSQNVKEVLRSAATKWKKGEDVKRSLVVVEYRVPLEYEGPRTEDELWEQGFRDQRMVANAGMNRGRVLRCRPKFDWWSLRATLAYDPEDLDFDLLEMIADRSQKYGLGDGRGIGFGAFSASLGEHVDTDLVVNGSALKRRHPEHERAHKAQVDRIVVG